MRTRSRYAWLLAALPALALGDSVDTRIQVSATVVPYARFTTINAPAQVQVTSGDLERGYLDVPASYLVSSNDPRGYLLRFDARSGLAENIEVRGLGASFPIGELGAESAQAATVGPRDHALSFRLHLSPDALVGTYDLPVLVSVTGL